MAQGAPARPVAVVTGGAGAIGTALTHRLVEAGSRVLPLDLAAEQAPDDPSFLACDITDDDAVRRAFAEVEERHGRLDLAVAQWWGLRTRS